jgi:hypothetical protein
MSKKLTTIILTSAIFVRGVMCPKDKVLKIAETSNIKNDEINEREAQNLINLSKATDEVEVEIEEVSFSEMTLKELGEVDYKKLNKDPLVEFATACGLEISVENKNEISGLIADVDFGAED